MNDKRIGLDCDEILLDFVLSICRFYNRKYGKFLEREHFKTYNFWDTWGGTKEQAYQEVEHFFNSEDFDKIKPVNGAVGSVNFLKRNNYDLFVITSRPGHIKEKTLASFERYFLRAFSDVYFSSEWHNNGGGAKSEICRENGIELIVEDSLDNAHKCAIKGIKVILLNCPWNRSPLLHENIYRVNSWDEIVKKIDELNNE